MSVAHRQILHGALLLFVAACAPMVEYRGPEDAAPEQPTTTAGLVRDRLESAASATGFGGTIEDTEQALQEIQGQEQGRQMIYSAQMTLEVARVEDAIAGCLETLRGMGGYLSQRRNSTLTCRVPAERFEDLLSELRTMGRVLNEAMQARDVTMEYVDLGIRLDNARKSRDRLLALLEQAEQVEDMLKIETELRRLTTEIEQMEGRLKYLEDQIAMSSVSVTFQAVARREPPDGPRRQSRFAWINMTGAEYVLRWF